MNKNKLLSLNFALMLIISVVAISYMIGSETRMIEAATSPLNYVYARDSSTGNYVYVPAQYATDASSAPIFWTDSGSYQTKSGTAPSQSLIDQYTTGANVATHPAQSTSINQVANTAGSYAANSVKSELGATSWNIDTTTGLYNFYDKSGNNIGTFTEDGLNAFGVGGAADGNINPSIDYSSGYSQSLRLNSETYSSNIPATSTPAASVASVPTALPRLSDPGNTGAPLQTKLPTPAAGTQIQTLPSGDTNAPYQIAIGSQVTTTKLIAPISLKANNGDTITSDLVYNDGTKKYISNGKTSIALTENTQINGKNILVDGAINKDVMTSDTSPIFYNERGTAYRAVTSGDGGVTYQTSGGNGWSEIDPQGVTDGGLKIDAKGAISGGTILKPIATDSATGNIYVKLGNNYYKQNADMTRTQIIVPEGVNSNAVPTKFDKNGNPTEWATPTNADGVKTTYTPKADGTWDSSVDRGQMTVFGTQWSFGAGQLLQGLQWAGIAAGLVVTLGTVFGMDKATVNAAAAGIAAGILAGKASYALLGKGGLNGIATKADGSLSWYSSPWASAVIGVATAWLVYNAMWSSTKTKTEIVTFDCLPWQAPHGGNDCELCNDQNLPCSEYRCKSLGQSCAIVNKGTTSERCVNVNPRDVSPPVITPMNGSITEGYTYFDVRQMPPGAGFKIKSKTSSTGCIPPFTPIKFGITTNEPSQCKIDIEAKGNYSLMSSYFGGDNLYTYNHTELLTLPSAKDFQNTSITLKNGKELTFYMRCQDAAGNSNEADYAMTLCVDPSPDTTPPVIQGSSVTNGGCVASTVENATVDFYVNEPAQCRWSFTDSDFNQMKNEMSCATSPVDINAVQSYTCHSILNGVARDGTRYYVRCKDQPNAENASSRNANRESYVFNLRGSGELKLKTIQPNETIYGVLNPTPVELYAETLFGCDNNKAICYYSMSDSDGSYVQFFDTNNADGVNTQRLDLTSGTYKYFVKCVDAGGNIVENSTSFKVNIDTNAPIIARAYQEDNQLKIVTATNAKCVFTNDNCDFLLAEGRTMSYDNSTVHVTDWDSTKKYYIKCVDEYRSEPADCSMIVGPTENFM